MGQEKAGMAVLLARDVLLQRLRAGESDRVNTLGPIPMKITLGGDSILLFDDRGFSHAPEFYIALYE